MSTPFTAAVQFLKWIDRKIVFWQGRFYIYGSGTYAEFVDQEIRAYIVKFCQDNDLGSTVDTRRVEDIVTNLRGLCVQSLKHDPPVWLVNKEITSDLIAMENGLLKVDDALTFGLAALLPHDPDFFSFVKIPFSFDPEATCPTWLKFLNESLPDAEVRDLLQEWFGSNLDRRNFCRWVLFFGQGADGKTVICVVLVESLGPANVSSVGLDQFDPKRTFPLAATIGKLANVVEELAPASKAAEGLLKLFVSGTNITIEEKYRPAFNIRPTAKLTFATNELPKLTDRSDGIWRRLILIPFENQILDESKQDKRLVVPKFWRDSGELPGIFLWALHGRSRLIERGHFEEPKACQRARDGYRVEMNPATLFLRQTVRPSSSSRISSSELYCRYSAFTEGQGERPLTASQFAQEVRRTFPTTKLSEHPVSFGKPHRTRAWIGLEYLAESGTPDTADPYLFSENTKERLEESVLSVPSGNEV